MDSKKIGMLMIATIAREKSSKQRKWDMFGLGIAIFYFSSEVEQFLHDWSIGSLCTINGVKKNFMALIALLGPLKVWLFLYFQQGFKNIFSHPKKEKNHFADSTGSLDAKYGVK